MRCRGTLALLLAALPLTAPAAQSPLLARDINTLPRMNPSSDPQGRVGREPRLPVMGGHAYLQATTAATGAELYRSLGVPGHLQLVKDIRPGARGSYPGRGAPQTSADFAVLGNTLFFAADDGKQGIELWKSDGTAAGTVLVKDLYPQGSGRPGRMVRWNNLLLFTARGGGTGPELWRTDGTKAGTFMIRDIQPGPGTSAVEHITPLGKIALFMADDGKSGHELWRTDGTAAGTVLVKDIRPGGASSTPSLLTAMGGRVYFQADDGQSGRELWVSDGTGAGTVLLRDVRPGVYSGRPTRLVALGRVLLSRAVAHGAGF